MGFYTVTEPTNNRLTGVVMLLLAVFWFKVNAQKDTTAIVNYTDKIIIKANIDTRTDAFFYRNKEEDTRLHLKPNNRYRLFLSLDYEFIGVSVGLVPKFLGANSDENLKGESSFTDYQFRFFLGRWVQGLNYSKVSGYYVRNTKDFAPNWIEGSNPYIQFNNLFSKVYGMSTSYVFNPNFSYRNIVYQNEWQKKSSGSLIGSLYYDYNIFDLNEVDVINREKFFNVRLAPTYYYTFVLHDNWFLSANLSPSLGLRFSKTESGVEDNLRIENNTYVTRRLGGGINLGYSSKKIIYGLNVNFSADWYNEDDVSTTENDQFYGILYFGYRFDPPKALDKIFHPNKY
ncbi:MAG: DUF4421 family protein [Allomuricauda sp.]|jgi:Domain of unknown function (DUF4421)